MPVRYMPIPGFLGYMAGSDGTIWSRRKKGPGKELLPEYTQIGGKKPGDRGYLMVTLKPEVGPRILFGIHKLILITFRGPRPQGLVGRHLDGDKTNNRLTNLKWGTFAENVADSFKHGHILQGVKHGMARLSEAEVYAIRRAPKEVRTSVLARQYGMTEYPIMAIRKRIAWKHLPEEILA